MKSKSKSELAELAGVSVLTLRRWMLQHGVQAEPFQAQLVQQVGYAGISQQTGLQFNPLLLPKFEVKASSDMSAILKALGANDVFKQLPGVATGPTKVDLCTQDACISVEEEGCSAAAVTAVSSLISPGGNSDYPTVTLNVNRPFLFAIQEQSTGIILFQGAVLSF